MLKFILEIFKKKEEETKSTVCQHSKAGRFCYAEGDIWIGKRDCHGREFEIVLSGNKKEPHESQVEKLLKILPEIQTYEKCALDYLYDKLPGDSKLFQILSLDLMWPDQEDYFAMSFSWLLDDYSIWKVEFHKGMPKDLSRDG